MKKLLIISGHLSLLLTAFLALYFYKERVLYVDPGQQVFQMINDGGYTIYAGRYSMVINQTFPLLAIKMGLSLKAIVLTYSMSFVVIYYACFLICVYGFRNIAAGLSIAFVPVVLREAFGHSISETWLGISYSAVFYALLNYYHVWKLRGRPYIILFYFLSAVLIAVNYFIHPITLFTLAFAVGFTWFFRKEFRSPHIYIISGLILCIYLYKFVFPTHEHDESFFAGIKKADVLLPDFVHLELITFFRWAFRQIYLFPTLVLAFFAALYIRKRKWLSLLFVCAFIVFFTIVAALAFYKRDGHMAMESRLMPFIFITMIPFIEIIKDWKKNYILPGSLLAISFLCYGDLVRIVRDVHTLRINTYTEALEDVSSYSERKFYTFRKQEAEVKINSWGSSVETLLLSSLNGPGNSRTIHYFWEGEAVMPEVRQPGCTFIWVPWWLYFDEQKINKRYFNLGCGAYREVQFPGS